MFGRSPSSFINWAGFVLNLVLRRHFIAVLLALEIKPRVYMTKTNNSVVKTPVVSSESFLYDFFLNQFSDFPFLCLALLYFNIDYILWMV